jgi:hypothetical protein
VEAVASLTQGRIAAAQCGLFIQKSVLVIFEPPCIFSPYISLTDTNIQCIYEQNSRANSSTGCNTTYVLLRSSLFLDVIQRGLVVNYRRSGQPIGRIFTGQAVLTA